MPKVFFISAGLCLLVCIVVCSCSSTGGSKLENTPAFDSVMSKAGKIYDSGYKARALAYVMTSYRQDLHPSIMDEIDYYNYCGEMYRKDFKENGRYETYIDSAIQVIEKNGLQARLADHYEQVLVMKADALFSEGYYSESYNYYYLAKKLAEDNRDSCSLSQFNYSLGMVLYRQQRFPDAAGDFMAAYDEARHCKDLFIFFYRRQELLDNVGLCFYHVQKYDSAMLFYRRAVGYIDSNYLRFDKHASVYIAAKAVVYGNMADLYAVLKKYDTARALLEQSIRINLQKGYANSDALTDQVKLCNLLQDMGNYAELKNVLTDIRVELDTIPDKQAASSLNRLLWQYYNHEKQFDSAYKYLNTYVLMNDSLAVSNKRLMATDVDGMIRTLEKQYQISMLNKSAFEEKIFLVVALLIVLMAIIIILLVVRNMQRSRDNIRALTELNKQMNEQKEKLQMALTELEVKDKDKSRVLRAAAHDLLNPIAAISGLVDIIKFDAENFTPEQKELLNLIKDTCENSISLSRDILDAATTTDKRNLQKEWVNINKLVASSIDLLQSRAANKNQRLVFTAAQDNIEANVNKEKIWRVINNLIGNAIKFSYENSDIQIRLGLKAGMVEIAVADKGIGIPEKNKKFIFNVFSEAKMPGTAGEVPHGLGLSISMQIARAHDGNIRFESEEGKGSTFYLEFPVNAS